MAAPGMKKEHNFLKEAAAYIIYKQGQVRLTFFGETHEGA